MQSVHLKLKPFVCASGACGKTFAEKCKLQKHMLSVHGVEQAHASAVDDASGMSECSTRDDCFYKMRVVRVLCCYAGGDSAVLISTSCTTPHSYEQYVHSPLPRHVFFK